MNEESPWKCLESRVAYQDPWLTLEVDKVTRPDGTLGTYSRLKMRPGVYTVALNEKQEVCLIRQYRYPVGQFLWELPGGGIEGELTDDTIVASAQRELQEETGLIAVRWQKIGSFNLLVGHSDEVMHIFLAEELTQSHHNMAAEEGISEYTFFPLTEILQQIQSGVFKDGESALAILHTAAYLKA